MAAATHYTQDQKGYVRLVQHMGSDLTHVNAARASFNKESTSFAPADEKLLNFLVNADIPHTSPFRHAFVTFEIKAPLFVARQWWKHIVGADYTDLETPPFKDTGWNEQSGRYIKYDDFWEPVYFRMAPTNKKQGSIDSPHPNSDHWLEQYRKHVEAGFELYDRMVQDGVAPEQARTLLGMNSYTRWYWSASFLAAAHFVNLRDHPDAQRETKEYADLISRIMQELFPTSWPKRQGLK
jgi:thymidylate synthase (FAD)